MNQIPLKFKMEMEDMNNLYTTIQDLRLFKDEIDDCLFEKLYRNSIGQIEAYHHWNKYAISISQCLDELQPILGEAITFDIKELDRLAINSSSKVNCRHVIHIATIDEPYWQLSYTNKMVRSN